MAGLRIKPGFIARTLNGYIKKLNKLDVEERILVATSEMSSYSKGKNRIQIQLIHQKYFQKQVA